MIITNGLITLITNRYLGSLTGLTPGEYSSKLSMGVCRPVLQILTLFQAKTCHFPHPFSDLASKVHTRFQTWLLKLGSHLCDKHKHKHNYKLATFSHVKQGIRKRSNVGGDLGIFKMADEVLVPLTSVHTCEISTSVR